MKKRLLFVMLVGVILFTGKVYAGNPALGVVGQIPLGERVANYLQGVFNAGAEIMDIKIRNTSFGQPEPFRGIVMFSSKENTIVVLMVGTMNNPEKVKPRFQVARNYLLSF